MGEVWMTRDTGLDRLDAIKRLWGKQSSRFAQEARAIAARPRSAGKAAEE